MKTIKNKKIDTHHHIVPKEYIEMLEEINITSSLGVDFPKWTPETSLAFMKKVGIETSIVSITSPGVYFKENVNLGFTKADLLAVMLFASYG